MAFSAHKDEDSIKEHYDNDDVLFNKVKQVAELIKKSNHTCFFTGAGISTDAGIPDFRGPNGVWTCKAKGVKPPQGKSTLSAIPTKTHMSILKLMETGNAHYLISQNCDGLHRRSGIPAEYISELHGNGNIEYCEDCGFQYLRDFHCYRITRSSDHYTGRHCVNKIHPNSSKVCNGRLLDSTIDFGQNLPQIPLQKAYENSKKANLHIALGSSLTVSPACSMPKKTAKSPNGNLVICNLQKTPLDHLCAVRIYQRCDVFMEALMKYLNIPIPEFKLKRNFKLNLQVLDNSNGKLQIYGCEKGTNGQDIPASLMKCVEIIYNGIPRRCTIQNHDQIPSFNVSLPLQSLSLRIHTMQHYAEPSLDFHINCNSLDCSKTKEYSLRFAYSPSLHEWEILNNETNIQCYIINYNNQNPFEEKQVHHSIKKNNIANKGNIIPSERLWSQLTKITDKLNEGCILLLGGASKSRKDSLMIFKTNKWNNFNINRTSNIELPYIDKSRWGHSTCVVENKYAFLFGGWDSTSQYNDMWLLDMENETLESLQCSGNIPSPRAGQSLDLIYNMKSLFLFGGSVCNNGKYEFFNDLYQFDPLHHTWKQLHNMKGNIPSPRSQHSTVIIDSEHLLVIGGYNGEKILNDVYLLHIPSLTWKNIQTSGDIPASISVSSKAYRVYPASYFAGILHPGNGDAQIFYYGESGAYYLDIKTWNWTKLNHIKDTRRGVMGTCITDSAAVLFGGIEYTDSLNDLTLYSICD